MQHFLFAKLLNRLTATIFRVWSAHYVKSQ